tara:strand:- start:263 stop:3142 length:2880 start_codon:yes stop_codon:yes gene_type:complete
MKKWKRKPNHDGQKVPNFNGGNADTELVLPPSLQSCLDTINSYDGGRPMTQNLGFYENGLYYPSNYIKRGTAIQEAVAYIRAVSQKVGTNLNFVHLEDLASASWYPTENSFPLDNNLMVIKLCDAGKWLSRDKTNRTKGAKAILGHLKDFLENVMGTEGYEEWVMKGETNSSLAFYSNCFNALIRGQWKNAEIGGPLQFRIVIAKEGVFLLCWSGENRHRALHNFMTVGFDVISEKVTKLPGGKSKSEFSDCYDPTEKRKLKDWYKLSKSDELVDIDKILTTFMNKVVNGNSDFKKMNIKNLKKAGQDCVHCQKAYDMIMKNSYIPVIFSETDEKLIMNDVESEYTHSSAHNAIMKMQMPMCEYIGYDIYEFIQEREASVVLLDDLRGKVKLSASKAKTATEIWNNNSSFSYIKDLLSTSGYQSFFNVRWQGVLLASIITEGKMIGNKFGAFDPLSPKQLALLKENDGRAMLNVKTRMDLHSVGLSHNEEESFEKMFIQNLKKNALAYLAVLEKIVLCESDSRGKLCKQPILTKWHPHQLVERIEQNLRNDFGTEVAQVGHTADNLTFPGNKQVFIKVHTEEYLSQLIRLRTILLVEQKLISIEDVPSFYEFLENNIGKRIALKFNNDDFRDYLKTTNNGKKFLEGCDKLKSIKDINKTYMPNAIKKYRKDCVSKEAIPPVGSDLTKHGPERDLTCLEILMVLGETHEDPAYDISLKISVDLASIMYDMTLIELAKEFDSETAKEDLTGIRKRIAKYLLENVFTIIQKNDTPENELVWKFDMEQDDKYISIHQRVPQHLGNGQVEYHDKEIKIWKKMCEDGKLPSELQLSHWISENHCKRTENGNFVLITHKLANNLGKYREHNHNLFHYVNQCYSYASSEFVKNGTRWLYTANLDAQELHQEYDLDKILRGERYVRDQDTNEMIVEKMFEDGHHYEVVEGGKDAIKKFKQQEVRFKKK